MLPIRKRDPPFCKKAIEPPRPLIGLRTSLSTLASIAPLLDTTPASSLSRLHPPVFPATSFYLLLRISYLSSIWLLTRNAISPRHFLTILHGFLVLEERFVAVLPLAIEHCGK